MRILPVERMPASLWLNNLLRLPPLLKANYIAHLDDLGLRERSLDTSQKDVHGGRTSDETLDHFARRFAVSAGRVEYSTLSPCEELSTLSDAFLSTFSDGCVSLLDIPCGTGAMTAALVSTLTALRAEGVIPRLPLTICVCAGDYSARALEIFESLMRQVVDPAAAQGITLCWEASEWDALRGDQTARLIDRWFAQSHASTEFFVVVSNFSGALHNQDAFAAFSPCFEQILARLHDKQSSVLWIEPATKGAKTGLLTRLTNFFKQRIRWFKSSTAAATNLVTESHYQIEHPVSGKAFSTNVIVHHFERT